MTAINPTLHDATKILMGSNASTDKIVGSYASDPASFPAGTVVRLTSSGLSKTTGKHCGISAGEDLTSSAKATAVFEAGKGVPILLTDDNVFASLTKGDLTFTSKVRGTAGNAITLTFTDDGAGAVEVEVTDTDIVVEMDDTAETGSTAADIKTAIEANAAAHALISVAIAEGQDDEVQDDFVQDALEGGEDGYAYVVPGQPVYVTPTTGIAVETGGGALLTAARYCDGAILDGVYPDGTTAPVALVDMVGGL